MPKDHCAKVWSRLDKKSRRNNPYKFDIDPRHSDPENPEQIRKKQLGIIKKNIAHLPNTSGSLWQRFEVDWMNTQGEIALQFWDIKE